MSRAFHLPAVAAGCLLLLACGGGEGPSATDAGGACPGCDAGAPDSRAPAESSYAVEVAPGTPGLRLEVSPGPDRAEVRIVTTGALEIFGLSLHVRYDAARFAVDDLTQAAFLGPESTEATMVAIPLDGDLVLGGTRNDPALGDAPIEEGTELASLTLRGLATGTGPVALDAVVARRSDGSYVALGAERGTLSLEEVAR